MAEHEAVAEVDSMTEPEDRSSAELKILQKYTWKLHEANIEPMRLVLDLVPHGFVTWMTYQRIKGIRSRETQSYEIINGLLGAVARQSDNFHRLLQILNEHPPLLSIVANKIKDEYHGILVADQTLQADEHVSNLKEFVFKFKKVVETANVDIDDLRQFIISHHPNNECRSKMKDTNDIDDIFVVLHTTFCSFFNYSILVRIAENFKLSDGFKVILTYEAEKDSYQKNLASIPLAEELQKENECFDYSLYNQCMIILGLQTSLVEHLTVLEFKEFIKRALHDYGDYLHLLKIEPAGSFIASFCAPDEVKCGLISQAKDKIACLADIGVNKLIIGDTVIIDKIEDAGKNARHWEAYLEEYTDVANSKTPSQNPNEATIKIYCDYLSKSETNPDTYVLVKAVALVLTHGDGFISLIPEKCFNTANVSDLFSALKCFLPHLDASLKKEVISFLINKCEPFRNVIIEGKFVTESHTCSQWLYKEGVLSLNVYQLLHDMHYMKNLTLSLLNALVLDDKPEIITFLMSKCSVSSSKLQKMASFACKEKNPIIASLFLEKMKSFTVDVIKGFSKCFDEDKFDKFDKFLQTCNPEKKGELLNFCFCSDKIEIKKRKGFAMAILKSGCIDPTKINLRDVLKYPKFLLLSDVSFLEKLLDAGVSLDSSLLHEAVKLIVDRFESCKSWSKERVELICILLEKGADVSGLEFAYSGSGGTVVHAATELALQTKSLHILKLVCAKTDVSECLYDHKKMTPLHVVMKQVECNEVSIEICYFLCHEKKIDPCIKDCDGLSAEDYCDDKSDKRLMILREASSLPSYPHTVGNKVKNQKMSLKKAIPKSEGSDQKEACDETDRHVLSHDSVAPNSYKKISPSGSLDSRSTYDKQSSHQADNSKCMTQHIETMMTYKKMERLLVDALHEDSSYFASKRPVNSVNHPTNESHDINDIIDESEGDAEELDEETKYEVFCSPRVKKFFETAHPKLIERVLCTIKKLACGEANVRLKRKMYSKIQTMYHGNVDSAKRVLWYKTVLYCPSRRSHCNVLVVLDVIIDHKKLDKALENAENWIKRGKEEGGVYTVDLISEGKPSCYEPVSEPSKTSKEVLFMMKDEYGAVPIYSLPEYVLKMIRSSPVSRLGLPLKLSYQEHCIVDMDPDETAIANMSYQESTILVVGRSGTGKTTCCLSRMWEEFRHYWEILNDNDEPIIPRLNHWRQNSKIQEPSKSNDELSASCMSKTEEQAIPDKDKCDHLHQVFVTKNPYLCQEVKHRFYDLVSSHHLLHKTHLKLEHAALPTSFNDLHFPLFITSRGLLMLMDSTLNNDSYFRWKNGKLLDIIANSEQLYNEENIGSLDDVDEFESDSEDEDENENELDEGIVTDGNKSGRTMIEVTALLFQNQIWNEISHKILKTMKIDPILVWQEIKSFIKGSVLSLTSVNGYLSKEEYFKIGKNKAPNFTENREVIYTLFQEYKKYCKSPIEKGKEYFDECDLLHHLYKHRSKFSCIIHNFYIDEVQDFTEAELYLLLSLSHCPNGNLLCGDSAQSIMRGVSFRFTDVRSLFYELDCSKIHQSKVVVPEKLHYLAVNYRAHAGIVNIADSVIELLGRFFKDSFDAIPRSIENVTYRNVIPTRKPLLLCCDSPEDMLARNQFAMDGMREIDFGAHQAVIILSKETVIPDSLKNSLVFTVLEAKGLEFNDVLLFNFFSESQVSKKSWELVSAYTCLEIEKSKEKIATKYIPVLNNYIESEHKALNAELKCLYTALTRAKRNLWIYDNFDNESESQHPMYNFFIKKGLVKKEFNKSDIGFTTEESTPEEWKAAGDFFMSRQLWEQARTSYFRAQDASRVYQVHAFMEAQKSIFLNAAGYFLKAGSIVHDRKVLIKAAKCFKAATFKISKDEKIHCHDKIARFLEKLGKIKRAGEFYILAKEYSHFIRLCEERGRWNRVIWRLLAAKQKIRALRKAIEYGDKVTIEGFEVRNLAHECVRFLMKNESKSFVKEVITNELKDKTLVAKYLAVYEFHDGVLNFYISSDEYSKALEYAWKHGLYDQGLEFAEIMDEDQEMKFLICHAYAKLAEGNVKKTLESLECARTKFHNENFDAQVLMLKAKFFSDILACKEAICIFEKLENEGGVIEAVNVLYSMIENPSATDVLKYSLRATRLSKVFITKKLSQAESQWILLYFELNQIQLLPDNTVLVPPFQAYWLQLQLNSTFISREKLNQKIREHFKKCYETWLTKISIKDASESLSVFKKSSSSEYPYIIGDIELYATFHNFFDSQMHMILNVDLLLAPFNLLNIFQNSTWQRHHLQSIQANVAILNMCKAEYKKVLKEQMCQNFNSLDQCMKLWRLSLITTGSTSKLHCDLKNADSSHIFCSWIDFPFSMTDFLSSTNDELLQRIICSPETFASISCENLLYILIVQSISSIFLISMHERKKEFFVPQIFSFVINNFNTLVSPEFSVIESCSKESEIYRLECPAALQLLQNVLFLLQNNCTSCFFSHENRTVMICYFILILTLYANMLIAESKPDSFYTNCNLLATKLQPPTSEIDPSFAKEVYDKMIAVSSIEDIFSIIDELLSETQNNTMNQICFNGEKIEYERILFHDIMIQLKKSRKRMSIKTLECFEPICKIKQDNISSNGDHELKDTAKPVFKILVIRKSDHKPPAMRTFFQKLDENMIINDFCKVCDCKINLEPKEKEYRDLEQNACSTPYDEHIRAPEHKQKKKQYEIIRSRREPLEKKVKTALKDIKQLHCSPYLLPDDDIALIEFDDQLSSILYRADEFDLKYHCLKYHYHTYESKYKELLEELKKIQQDMEKISERVEVQKAASLQKSESSRPHEPIETNAVILDLLGRKK